MITVSSTLHEENYALILPILIFLNYSKKIIVWIKETRRGVRTWVSRFTVNIALILQHLWYNTEEHWHRRAHGLV